MEWISGNIFIRPLGGRDGMVPGQTIPGHPHNFDHTTIFFDGQWRVRKWGRAVQADGSPLDDVWVETEVIKRNGPFHLLIKAECKHEITYVNGPARGMGWCVYSHRTPQGEVSIDNTGWRAAYE